MFHYRNLADEVETRKKIYLVQVCVLGISAGLDVVEPILEAAASSMAGDR